MAGQDAQCRRVGASGEGAAGRGGGSHVPAASRADCVCVHVSRHVCWGCTCQEPKIARVCMCVCLSVKILEIQGCPPGTVRLGGPEGHYGVCPLGQMLEKFSSFQALSCL